jgi:hypothetical protein
MNKNKPMPATNQHSSVYRGSIKLLSSLCTVLLCILSLYPSLTRAQQNDLPTIPIGRLIKATLVNTLESGAVTPLVGLVSEDLWWNGKKIITVNSEIHGLSQPVALRDRIGCENQFVVVCQDGKDLRELHVQGIVLDRDDANAAKGVWGITDGSYGIKGEIIKNGAFVRVPIGHKFYLYVQKILPPA